MKDSQNISVTMIHSHFLPFPSVDAVQPGRVGQHVSAPPRHLPRPGGARLPGLSAFCQGGLQVSKTGLSFGVNINSVVTCPDPRIAVNSVKKEKLAEAEAEEDVRVWSHLFR